MKGHGARAARNCHTDFRLTEFKTIKSKNESRAKEANETG